MLSKAGIRMSKELPNLSSEEIKLNVSKRESIQLFSFVPRRSFKTRLSGVDIEPNRLEVNNVRSDEAED